MTDYDIAQDRRKHLLIEEEVNTAAWIKWVFHLTGASVDDQIHLSFVTKEASFKPYFCD